MQATAKNKGVLSLSKEEQGMFLRFKTEKR